MGNSKLGYLHDLIEDIDIELEYSPSNYTAGRDLEHNQAENIVEHGNIFEGNVETTNINVDTDKCTPEKVDVTTKETDAPWWEANTKITETHIECKDSPEPADTPDSNGETPVIETPEPEAVTDAPDLNNWGESVSGHFFEQSVELSLDGFEFGG